MSHVVTKRGNEERENAVELQVVCRLGVNHQHVELLEHVSGVPVAMRRWDGLELESVWWYISV